MDKEGKGRRERSPWKTFALLCLSSCTVCVSGGAEFIADDRRHNSKTTMQLYRKCNDGSFKNVTEIRRDPINENYMM